ncbi:SRPBCC domain-containing protein [Polaromonas jejuensis]|uniref:SRPBCC domain-containing protein n=1 Tax=Polaromonas jejuensis TaxID=457502 RepID=A0ABW0Q9Z5_9BURK|nr:SRPBCC domain-containing protein [Polaromonas jejuensis]
MSHVIHQEIVVTASPQRVYSALTDSKQFSAFSGAPAEISPEAGGVFSCFGGMIVGRNLELMANERIVQAWRVANWEAGVYSVVRFALKAQGADTLIVFDHTGFPEGTREHLDSGWHAKYWEPLNKYLG